MTTHPYLRAIPCLATALITAFCTFTTAEKPDPLNLAGAVLSFCAFIFCCACYTIPTQRP